MLAKIEYRIPNQLSRAVESNIAAAVAFEHLHAAEGQLFRGQQNVAGIRVASEGDDRRVLKQKKHISDAPSFTQSNELLLDAHSSGIIEAAEIKEGDHHQISLYGCGKRSEIKGRCRVGGWTEKVMFGDPMLLTSSSRLVTAI
jgi:hypothetical protein